MHKYKEKKLEENETATRRKSHNREYVTRSKNFNVNVNVWLYSALLHSHSASNAVQAYKLGPKTVLNIA